MPDSSIVETIPQVTAPDAKISIPLAHQIVSGGQGLWYGTAARSLPWAIDDITLALADDLYDRMLVEPVVAASVNIFKAGILADGVSLSSAVDDKDDGDYAQAADLVDWCEDILAGLDMAVDDVLYSMLDAIAYGNKVAELVYEPYSTYTGSQQIILKGLHVKPRHALAFVVDRFKSTLGFLALIPGQNVWPQAGIQIPDIAAVPNFVPKEKFAILTFRPVDNDPRGTSLLRPAYDPWWRKQETKVDHRKYLSRFASPSLAGFTPKGALPTVRLNADGSTALDPNGNPVYDYPNDVMRDALLAFQNGTVVTFPDGSAEGSRLQVIEASGDGKAFLTALEMHDREIVKAILTATLAVGEGEHASRAQAGVHQDAQDTLIAHTKGSVAGMLYSVLKRAVQYNYGDKAARLTPKVSLGGIEQQDLAKIWSAVGQLATSGYIDPSQYAELDSQINLPERTMSATLDAADSAVPPGTQPPVPPEAPAPAVPPTPPVGAPPAKPATGKAAMSKRVRTAIRPRPADLNRVRKAYTDWSG